MIDLLRARSLRGVLIPLFLVLLTGQFAWSLENPGDELAETGVVSKLNAQVNPEIRLTDSDGQSVRFGDLLSDGLPTILIPVYYDCPRLCGLVLSGAISLFNSMSLKLGKEYKVLAVSFDHEESPELAAKRAKEYHKQLAAQDVSAGAWRFLVGEQSQVSELMSTVGFGYKKDGDEFAHSAALFILTPDGKVSQYFTGIEFSAWDVRLAVIDASSGGIGSAIDHVLLYCFRFDSGKGKYTLAVFRLLRVVGVLTLLGLGVLFFYASRKGVKN